MWLSKLRTTGVKSGQTLLGCPLTGQPGRHECRWMRLFTAILRVRWEEDHKEEEEKSPSARADGWLPRKKRKTCGEMRSSVLALEIRVHSQPFTTLSAVVEIPHRIAVPFVRCRQRKRRGQTWGEHRTTVGLDLLCSEDHASPAKLSRVRRTRYQNSFQRQTFFGYSLNVEGATSLLKATKTQNLDKGLFLQVPYSLRRITQSNMESAAVQ